MNSMPDVTGHHKEPIMRHIVLSVGLAAVSLFAAAACAQAPELEDDPAVAVEQPLANNSSGYTTRDVCKKCGCTPTELACDCGLSGPSEKEKACLENGGPTKVFARPGVLEPIGGGGAGVFAP